MPLLRKSIYLSLGNNQLTLKICGRERSRARDSETERSVLWRLPFDGMLPSQIFPPHLGTTLTQGSQVNRPRARSRGDSYSSQRSYTPNRTAVGPRDPEQGPPFSRRPSFREPYGHVRNFSRSSVDGPHHVRNLSRQSTDSFISPPRIEGRLISSVSEVFQHNAALNRMGPPMPLESIENHYGRNPQNKLNNEYRCGGESPSQTIQYKGKENSPMKSDKPPMTSSRKSSFSSQAGGQGSKRKNNNKRTLVSRQNS